MEMNGNGLNGDERKNGELSFGPFRVERRQMRAFWALTCVLGVIIIAFMAWQSAASGDADSWHAIIAGVIDGFLWRLFTAAVIAIMAINAWEANMGQINPLAIMGVGEGPKWWRDQKAYAEERVAQATADLEEKHKREMAEAKARWRRLGAHGADMDDGEDALGD